MASLPEPSVPWCGGGGGGGGALVGGLAKSAPPVPLPRHGVEQAPLQPSTAVLSEASPAAPLLPTRRRPFSRSSPELAIQATVGPSSIRIQAAHTMERSPVSTRLEAEQGFSSGSPSALTPLVEVVMPMPRVSPTAKRTQDSTTGLTRIDRTKRARCVVGSPTLRIINQMQLSARSAPRSPTITTAQNPQQHRKGTSRQLRSVHWKEFDPIIQNGEIVYAKCIHCEDYLSGKQNIGTSHLKKHLERCKSRSKVKELVDKLRAGATPSEVDRLKDWIYDSDLARRALIRMIVLHELPFSIVKYDGFIEFIACLNPLFKMPSRTTIKLDCIKTFEDAKMALREVLKNSTSKVSLTADMWTSNQTLGYLCVTCHYISSEWKINKRIIIFLMMESPHNAQSMFDALLKGIQEWNLEDKLFSITLDNAKVNNSMMELLRSNLLRKKMLPCKGNLFHVRCGAHVINLVVQDGLKKIGSIVHNIRESVKYIKSSQARKEKFEQVAVQVGVSIEKQPTLDISTRWNSTYYMLKSAQPFASVFDELAKQDKNYTTAPSLEEWKRSKVVCGFLKKFADATEMLSGSSYPTANLYFHELWKIKLEMDVESSNEDEDIAAMVRNMQKKFMKYWEISYLSLCIPVVLDPRFKYAFVAFRLNQFFGADATIKLDRVNSTLRMLFREYSSQIRNACLAQETCSVEVNNQKDDSFDDWDRYRSVQLRNQTYNELESYLADQTIPRSENFDILNWWKTNCAAYPTIARMACDVL